MSTNLKCPFCGAELNKIILNPDYMTCRNYKCDASSSPMHKNIWQAIIDGKAAQDALKVAKQKIEKWYNAFKELPQYGAFASEFKNALDEIAPITTGKDK